MNVGTMTTADTLALYAEAVWTPTDLIEIRCFPQKRQNGHAAPVSRWLPAETLHMKAEELATLNASGLNVTAGVLPRDKEGGRADEDTLAGWVLWADLDGIEPREAWTRAKSAGLPSPSTVVNSGHGVHLYWKLQAAIEPAILSKAVEDLAALLESDSSVKNPSRILRLPGFQNLKDPVAPVELLYAKPELQYSWDEIRAVIPRTVAEIARHTVPANGGTVYQGGEREALIEQARRYVAKIEGAAPGGRTTKAFRVAAVLQNDYGLSEGEALPILSGWDSTANNPAIQNDPQYGLDELANIMKNARKHAKKAPGRLADNNRRSPRTSTPSRIALPAAEQGGSSELREIFRAEGRGERRTISLPWPRLSSLTSALRPGFLSVVAAPAGHAKSLFALQIALHAYRESGAPFAFLPLEDSKADFMRRCLAYLAGDWSIIDDDPETARDRETILEQYRDDLEDISRFVCENPKKPTTGADGKPTVPPLPHDAVSQWAIDTVQNAGARVVVIDPLAQVGFDYPEYRGQKDFVCSLVGIAAELECSIVLVAHLVKRSGKAGSIPATGEDIQGCAELKRLSQVVILLDHHEEKTSEVYRPEGLREAVSHDRTVIVDKTRGTGGRGKRLAFRMESGSPRLEELGVIAPKAKQ